MTATNDLCLPGEISAGESARSLHPVPPAEILASIPSLLGFRPSPRDLIVLGSFEDTPPDGRGRIVMRFDLPDWPNPIVWHMITHRAAAILAAQHYDMMTAVGYGPDALVSPLVHVLRHAADTRGVRLADFLRVRDGRYWSCLCQDPDCCSPGGTAFTLPDAPGVLASRDVLVATLAPADGKAAESMRAATARAARMTRHAAAGEGLDAAVGAITRYGKGDREWVWLSWSELNGQAPSVYCPCLTPG